jgi:Aminoglycoside-2''-adenylyltransferase
MKNRDMKELLHAFNAHRIKYLVVGGYAVGVHTEPRATEDLDIFIRADEQNSQAVYRALADYGALPVIEEVSRGTWESTGKVLPTRLAA